VGEVGGWFTVSGFCNSVLLGYNFHRPEYYLYSRLYFFTSLVFLTQFPHGGFLISHSPTIGEILTIAASQ